MSGVRINQLTGVVADVEPGNKCFTIIAHSYQGGRITVEVRWYKSHEEATADLKRIASSAVDAGADQVIMQETIEDGR